MERNTRVEVAEGLWVSVGKDGHWLQVEIDGKHGAINIEAVMRGITKFAFVRWADGQLDRACERCQGYGDIPAPYSDSDPSCPDCDGEGIAQ